MNFSAKSLKTNFLKIFNDCLLPNGCLVAAPTHQIYYPKEAKSYLYAWPGRDTGFILAALIILGEDYYQPICNWLWTRAEDFQHSPEPELEGLIFKSYHPNGLIREHQFQPDQLGTLLWSLSFKTKISGQSLSPFEQKVFRQASLNLARVWQKDKFSLTIEDLWEERSLASGDGVFTYSLAACLTGLKAANYILKNKTIEKAVETMQAVIRQLPWDELNNYPPRSFGGDKEIDYTPDGSLAGLIWPFPIGLSQLRLRQLVNTLEEKLLSTKGVHRYPADRYEGADGHNHENKKAGAWPLLTFWLAIAYNELGDKKKAQQLFNLTFDNLADKRFIPEQIFCCNSVPWTGVSPLLWSHAMAVLAAWKLGLLSGLDKEIKK